MKYIMYGGSESGEIFFEYAQAENHQILAIIDKNAEELLKKGCFKNSLIVKQISDLDKEIIKQCEEIIIALGSNGTALEIAKIIKKELQEDLIISTIHDDKYSYFYKHRIELNYIKSVSVLAKQGWYISNEKQESIDINSKPLPWYTYSSIDFIEKRINKNLTVFEYSCGNGTLWWSDKVKEVDSVEHNANWYSKIKERSSSNTNIQLCIQKDDYIESISRMDKKYHIVVIDGIERNECAFQAVDALTPDGIIIWDNSDRVNIYKNGLDFLVGKGFKQLEFKGAGPINDYKWGTSIFYRNQNVLGI